MKKLLAILVLGLLWCNVVLSAEEVFYCTEEGSTGFDTKTFVQEKYKTSRFKAKMDLKKHKLNIEGKEWIWTGATTGDALDAFHSDSGPELINFYNYIYKGTYEFHKTNIFGGGDDIWVSYGNCTKF